MADRVEIDLSLNSSSLVAEYESLISRLEARARQAVTNATTASGLNRGALESELTSIQSTRAVARSRVGNVLGERGDQDLLGNVSTQELDQAVRQAANRLGNSSRSLIAAQGRAAEAQEGVATLVDRKGQSLRSSIQTEVALAKSEQTLAALTGRLGSLRARRAALESTSTSSQLVGNEEYISIKGEEQAVKSELDRALKGSRAAALTTERLAATASDNLRAETQLVRERILRLQAQLGNVNVSASLQGDIVQLQRTEAALREERNARLLGFGSTDERKAAEQSAVAARQAEAAQLAQAKQLGNINRRLARMRETNAAREAAQTTRLEAAREERIEAERKAAASTARTAKATAFQRVQARFSADPNADPANFQTAGGFIGRRALTTAGYALPSALLYGGVRAVRELTREASELEVQFSLVESQFNAFGGSLTDTLTGASLSMADFRKQILDTSKATGVEADQLADTARQMAGAFSEVGADGVRTPDFSRALREAEAAAQISRVSSLELQDVTDAVTATTIAFENQGLSVEQIGDLLVGLEAQYGVLGAELINFTADLAPLGAELGFTAEQLTALGAVAQRISGRSGATLAEQFGRILPALQDNRMELVQLIGTNKATAASQQDLTEAFATGDIPRVLKVLVGEYENLTGAQRNALVSIAGGRREASTLFSILSDGQSTLEALNNTSVDDFAGDLESRFAEVRDTVSFSFTELRRIAEEFGLAIFDAGLADALIAGAKAASLLFKALKPIVDIITTLNNLLGGLPMQFLALAGAAKAAGAAWKAMNISSMTSLLRRPVLGPQPIAGATVGREMRANPGRGGLLDREGGRGGLGRTAMTALRGTATFGAFLAIDNYFSKTGEAAQQVEEAATTAQEKIAAATEKGEANREAELDRLERQARAGLRRQGGRVEMDGPLGWAASAGASLLQGIGIDSIGGKDLDIHQQQLTQGGLDEYRATLGAVAAARADEHIDKIQEWLTADSDALLEALGTPVTDYQDTNGIVGAALRASGGKLEASVQTTLKDSYVQAWIDQAKDLGMNVVMPSAEDVISGDFEAPYIEMDEAFLRNEQNLQTMIDLAREGNILFVDQLKQLEAEAKGKISGVSEAIAEGERAAVLLDDMENSSKNVESALALYEAGQIGGDELLGALSSGIENLKDLRDASSEDESFFLDFINTDREFRDMADKVIGDIVSTNLEVANTLAQAEGRVDPDIAGVENLQIAITDAADRGASVEELSKLSSELLQAERALFEKKISEAETIEESIAIAEAGGTFSKAARLAAGVERLRTLAVSSDVELVAKFLGATTDEINQIVITNFQNFGTSAQDTIQGLIQSSYQQKLVAAKIRDRFSVFTGAVNNQTMLVAETLGQMAAAAQDFDDIFDIEMGGGAQASNLRAEKARDDAANAQQAAADARQEAMDYQNSLLDVEAARAGDDARRLASIAQQRAQISARYATSAAERNQALAAAIEADRDMASALFEIFESSSNILIAQAEAEGDSVGAARERLRVLQERQRRAGALGLGEASQNNLKAEIASAQASVRDSQLSAERETIDYQLAIGQISQGQAIAAMQSLLSIPEITEKQIREINLAIKGMRDQLGQDYQFNLPTQLALPTAYEVRRMSQTPGGSGAYTDARQITINFTATNPGDAQAIANQIVEEFSRPSRFGTVPRGY